MSEPTTDSAARPLPTCARWVVALLVAQLASACGVGVGGTGTGETALAAFGATAAPICAGPLASRLACPGALPGSPVGVSPETALVYLADGTGNTQVLARIEGNRIDLDAPCLRIRFTGEWGRVPGEAERFYGSLTTAAGDIPVLATLSAQSAGSGLVLLLQDLDGRVRFGPRVLFPVTAPPAPGACS
jgi:hypothetical protein